MRSAGIVVLFGESLEVAGFFCTGAGVRHLASSVFEVYHSALNRLLNNPLHALRGLKGAAVVFCRNGQGGSLS